MGGITLRAAVIIVELASRNLQKMAVVCNAEALTIPFWKTVSTTRAPSFTYRLATSRP